MPRKPGIAKASAIRSMRASGEKHPAPADQIADDAGARGAQEIAAHGCKQQLADRDLALRHRNAVAGERERDREYAAGGHAGEHAQTHQRLEICRQPAGERGDAADEHAHRDQPRLAEHVGERAEHRLHQRIGQGEAGRQQRRGGRLDVQSAGDLRNDRIDRAHEQRRRENHERHEIEDAAHCGSKAFSRHQRFASRSNSTSVRNSGSISFSGIMLGPSDGALDRDPDASR